MTASGVTTPDDGTRGADYPVRPELLPSEHFSAGRYRIRFARDASDLHELQRLRFEVFNLELSEGLQESFATGRDEDVFDLQCHHLVVELVDGADVVGTYRVQTRGMARAAAGFYSDNEFELSELPDTILQRSVETGRACIHADHRNRQVLFLLWRGLAAYMTRTGNRYLFGCSSINSTEPRDGLKLMTQLRALGQVRPDFEVAVRPACSCAAPDGAAEVPEDWPEIEIPRLFKTYLRYGSKVCGGPALDREFGTIDFLTLLDTEDLSERSRQMFFGD